MRPILLIIAAALLAGLCAGCAGNAAASNRGARANFELGRF